MSWRSRRLERTAVARGYGGQRAEAPAFIAGKSHYYPFGMNHLGPWYETVAPENKHLYNGKELNGDYEINLMDYGARWYDPAIGRWNAVDPMAEEYYPYSPYNYTLGNPISLIDPNGMSVDDIYFLFWPGDEDKPGHAAVAIDEYDEEGNKTGNVIVFEIFPGEEYGTFDMPTSNMDADYKVTTGKSLEEIERSKSPTGIIQISTTPSQDKEATSSLSDMKNNADATENKYNAESNNCCDIVTKALDSVYPDSDNLGNSRVDFKVKGWTMKTGDVTNPNKLKEKNRSSRYKRGK
ncbi:MAG: hypothetical protein H6556_22360 [Lewinellaceae bacterium]|nr:hypothetical protein [Lewinellaceae bacterium]